MVHKVKLWFDPKRDYLEVTFSDARAYMQPTRNNSLVKHVDERGLVIGFSVFGVSKFQKDRPLEAGLDPET